MLSSCWSVVLLGLCAFANATTTVYFPAPESAGDERSDYQLMLLRLAFEKAHADYRVERTQTAMQQGRALEELGRGSGIVRIVATMTSAEREAKLLPIRIPLFKGLIGWRVPLVPADSPDLLKNVKSLSDLARFRAGQGLDWPDTQILRSNHLPVEASATYEGMFKMLGAHRFDYFPRSIVEIQPEARTHANDNVTIDKYIALHYTAAVYFFVNRADTALADAISKGLELAIADGSFDRLFYSYHRDFILQADFANRTVIEIENPLLPKETPRARTALWFVPDRVHLDAAKQSSGE